MKKNAHEGFTLIELMIVVMIIGILATMAVPSFNKAVENGREKEARVALQLIYSAEKVYRLDKKIYAVAASTADADWANLASYIDNPNGTAKYYKYTVTPANTSTFTATATRNGSSKTITIDNTGAMNPP